MSMASSARASSRGFPHHIGQIEFAVDVADDLPQIGTPDRLALAIRQELLATVDQVLDDAGVDTIAVTIGDITLELGHFDAPVDWDAVRAALYAQLQSAISPYLPHVTPQTPAIGHHGSPHFMHLTVVTLKALARARGLPVSGSKANLADRITQYQSGQWRLVPTALAQIKTAGDVRRMITGTDTHDTEILRAALRGWADDDIKIAIQQIGYNNFSPRIGTGPYAENLLECLTHDANAPAPKAAPTPNVAAPQKYTPELPDAKTAHAICHDHPDVAPIFSLFVAADHLSAYISSLLPQKTGPLADAIAQLAQNVPAQRAVLAALYAGQPIDIAAARVATTLPLQQSQAALAEIFMQMGDDPYTATHATLNLNQMPAAAPPAMFRTSRRLTSSDEKPDKLQGGQSAPRASSDSRDPDVLGPDLHRQTKTNAAIVAADGKTKIDQPTANFNPRAPEQQLAVYSGSHSDTPDASLNTPASVAVQSANPSSDISPDAPGHQDERTAPPTIRLTRAAATLSPTDQGVRDINNSKSGEPETHPHLLSAPGSYPQTEGRIETTPLTSRHDHAIAAQAGRIPDGSVKPSNTYHGAAQNDDVRSRRIETSDRASTTAAPHVITHATPQPRDTRAHTDVSDSPAIDSDRTDALAQANELNTPPLMSEPTGNDGREKGVTPVDLTKGSDHDASQGLNDRVDPLNRTADLAKASLHGPDHANDTTTADLPRSTPGASKAVTASLPKFADRFPPDPSQETTTAATTQINRTSPNASPNEMPRSGQLSSDATPQMHADPDASQVSKGAFTSHRQRRPIAHDAAASGSDSSTTPSAHVAPPSEPKLTPRLNLDAPESGMSDGLPGISATPTQRLRALFDKAFGDESDAFFAQIRLIFSALAPAVGGASGDSAIFWAALMAAVQTKKPTHDLSQAVQDFATALIPDARKRGIAIRGAIARLGYPAVASAQMRQDAQHLLTRMMQPADGTSAALQAKPSTLASANRLQTVHAGLVLFHPYIKMLFERLEIARDKNSILEDDLPLAAAALHRLALGDAASVQPTDPLHKCLMGLAQDTPSVTPAPLPDAQAALIDGLVQSVIAQWGRLGSTSADGLRAAFVLRGGLLDLSDPQNAHLTVNKGPFDMLLDGLPWALTMVALPWMPAPLMIDWRGSND